MKKETKKKEPIGKKNDKISKKRKFEKNENEVSDDDDAEYFKKELGVEPDKNIMKENRKGSKSFKKRRYENTETKEIDNNVSNRKNQKIVNFDKGETKKINKPKFFKYSARKKQLLKTK